MESRWRSNVWDLGLNDGYVYLVARESADPGSAVVANDYPPYARRCFAYDLGGDQGWQLTTYGYPPPDHPHFPFGYDVEPD